MNFYVSRRTLIDKSYTDQGGNITTINNEDRAQSVDPN